MRNRRNYHQDPYLTRAKFSGTCSTCGKRIDKGDSIVYDKYRKLVYCIDESKKDCGSQLLRDIQAEKSMDQYGTDIY